MIRHKWGNGNRTHKVCTICGCEKITYGLSPEYKLNEETFKKSPSCIKKQKNWVTLNAHAKACLKSFLYAISASDILTSQIDYLYKNDFIREKITMPSWKEREEIAGYALTDLGIYTATHYFPKFTDWDWKIKYLNLN